jgi:hypothetical protein
MKSIVTPTMNPTVDIAAIAESVVHTSKVRCTSVRRDPGGGGINVARAVHKLGGDVIAVYTAGGAPGDRLRQLRDREGLDRHPVLIENDMHWSPGGQDDFGLRARSQVIDDEPLALHRAEDPGTTGERSRGVRCSSSP